MELLKEVFQGSRIERWRINQRLLSYTTQGSGLAENVQKPVKKEVSFDYKKVQIQIKINVLLKKKQKPDNVDCESINLTNLSWFYCTKKDYWCHQYHRTLLHMQTPSPHPKARYNEGFKEGQRLLRLSTTRKVSVASKQFSFLSQLLRK